MSFHYLPELVADCLAPEFSDGARFALLKHTPTVSHDSSTGKLTGGLTRSRSGTTCGRSVENLGGALLTLYLVGFRARATQRQLEEGTALNPSLASIGESLPKSLPGLSLPRMSHVPQSRNVQVGSETWVTTPGWLPLVRKTWVLTTFGPDFGYLHTPTKTANFSAPSMQKHQCCRNFVEVFGKPTQASFEWLMGLPIGWTGPGPLVTPKFHSAWQPLGKSLEAQ